MLNRCWNVCNTIAFVVGSLGRYVNLAPTDLNSISDTENYTPVHSTSNKGHYRQCM